MHINVIQTHMLHHTALQVCPALHTILLLQVEDVGRGASC